MSQEQDTSQTKILDEVSDELTRGIERCHTILDDYRSKLAANSNERSAANEDEDDQSRLG